MTHDSVSNTHATRILSDQPGKLSDEVFALIQKASDPGQKAILQDAAKLIREVERTVWNGPQWAREWAFLVLARALPYESLPAEARARVNDQRSP